MDIFFDCIEILGYFIQINVVSLCVSKSAWTKTSLSGCFVDETQTGTIEDVCALGPSCMILFVVAIAAISLVSCSPFELSFPL